MAALLVLACAAGALRAQRVIDTGKVEELGHCLLVRDLDGDGKAEILAGAPHYTHDLRHFVGRVVIIRGGDGDVAERLAGWIGDKASETFGTSIALGDVDGDQQPDLLVGAPGAHGSKGGAYLLHGGSDGGEIMAGGDLSRSDGSLAISGSTERAALGRAVAIGDLDGDGFGDLILAEPMADVGTTPQAGRVLVLKGRKSWTQRRGTIGTKGFEPDLVIVGREREGLGSRLLTADLDGDGIQDLIMASPWYGDQRGSAVVVKGKKGLLGKGRPGKRRTLVLDKDDPDLVVVGNRGSRLGESLCAMDLDGDGTPELVISEPLRDDGKTKEAGAVHVIAWDASKKRIDLGRSGYGNVATLRGVVAHEKFGSSVTCAATGGDAAPDLLVGSPAIGRVVLYQDPPSFDPRPDQTRALMPSGSLRGFGHSLGAGDLDGDGKVEIVISAPASNRLLIY